MIIDADKIRELAARGERSTLDFKKMDYGWQTSKAANAELLHDPRRIGMVGHVEVNDPPSSVFDHEPDAW